MELQCLSMCGGTAPNFDFLALYGKQVHAFKKNQRSTGSHPQLYFTVFGFLWVFSPDSSARKDRSRYSRMQENGHDINNDHHKSSKSLHLLRAFKIPGHVFKHFSCLVFMITNQECTTIIPILQRRKLSFRLFKGLVQRKCV